MDLDSILNVVIPIAIFVAIGFLVYGNNKEAIDKTLVTIKGFFNTKKQELKEHTTDDSFLTYK